MIFSFKKGPKEEEEEKEEKEKEGAHHTFLQELQQ